jgi:hypothetical protein
MSWPAGEAAARGTEPMASDLGGHGRALGVWGSRAYAWSGEERPRAAGFPIDGSGRQRVLGFPAGLRAPSEPGRLRHRGAPQSEGRRTRLVIAVVAILGRRGADQP